MIKLKTSLLAAMVLASACIADTATASEWQVYNGGTGTWSKDGSATLTGPTNITYLGSSVPCTATLRVSIFSGIAMITDASFTGSFTCTGIDANALPWSVSSPTSYIGPNPPFTNAAILSGTEYSILVSRLSLTVPPPLNVTCSGNLSGQLDNGSGAGSPPTSNKFVFKQTLSNGCTFQTRTNTNPLALVASPTIRWVP